MARQRAADGEVAMEKNEKNKTKREGKNTIAWKRGEPGHQRQVTSLKDQDKNLSPEPNVAELIPYALQEPASGDRSEGINHSLVKN